MVTHSWEFVIYYRSLSWILKPSFLARNQSGAKRFKPVLMGFDAFMRFVTNLLLKGKGARDAFYVVYLTKL